MTECECCFNSFSRSHKEFTCGCNYKCCSKCMKSYLLDSSKDPHCMNCKRGLDHLALCKWLGISWINITYKKHIDNLLFEQEIAKLPNSQSAAKTTLQILDLDKKLKQLKHSRSLLINKRKHFDSIDSFSESLCKDLSKKILDNWDEIEFIKKEKRSLKSHSPIKKHFIQKCGVDGCLGSLSTAWKCEMCDTFSCSKCHAIKGKDLSAPHICNPDDIASVLEIKKSTKNCPGCGAATSKIKGCDQMFCTVPGCETAFSFNTGLKDSGNIHNPHFFEMQRLGLLTAQNTRAPGDRLCGGPPHWSVVRFIRYIFNDPGLQNPNFPTHRYLSLPLHFDNLSTHYTYFYIYMYEGYYHVNAVLDHLRTRTTTAVNNNDLHIKFLIKHINLKQFKSRLARRNKKRKVDQEILHVLELFSAVLLDQLLHVCHGVTNIPDNSDVPSILLDLTPQQWMNNIRNAHLELNKVIDYCNLQFNIIGDNYKLTPKYIPPTFNRLRFF